MSQLKDLQTVAQHFHILYVEDNGPLREKAKVLLEKFFASVDLAEDGEVALSLFKKNHYPIVITDIKMPKMDGFTLARHIKKIQPASKVIIISAFDDKEYLLKGIELGIYRYLRKPVNVTELSKVLYSVILEIRHEQHTKIFYSHLKSVFDYQSSMVAMLHKRELILANDMFLEFFDFDCMEACRHSLDDISAKFLKHDSFLYSSEAVDVVDTILSNPQKLFHIKMQDSENRFRHFILKYQNIPEKDGYGILSFDDVTELNLLAIFDQKQTKADADVANSNAMYDLLNVIQRNSAKVDIHNYYKGLSITNSAVITEINDDSIVLKTSYMQLKAIQLEQKTYIYSSALPFVVEAREIEKISFEKQEVVLKSLSFVESSPIERATIRVVPSEKQSISLFLGENKFNSDIIIEDISLDGVKLKLKLLPAGLQEEENVLVDIVLYIDKKPIIINSKVKILKIHEAKHSFSVVFLFEDLKKSNLVKYITKRQMELIREIKAMQNG